MENDSNPALRSDELPSSDIQIFVAQEGAGDAQAVAHGDQIGSVNSTPTLEIVFDGSDLLHSGIGHDGLELSIMFEKNIEEEGLQSALADHLDGVEVRVSLDSTQTMGVEVLSSRHGDHATLQHELAVEAPHGVLDAGAHTLPAPNMGDQFVQNDVLTGNCMHTLPAPNSANAFVESDDVKVDCVCTLPAPNPCNDSDNAVENCDKGDENQSKEKKRSREELVENGRCLKSKTMENNKTEELEKRASSVMEAEEDVEHPKPCTEEVSVVQSLNAESTKTSSGMELEDGDTNGEKLCENVITTIGSESVVIDGTSFKAKEACSGVGTEDNTCNKESMERATDASKDDNVCDKDNAVADEGRERPRKKRKIAMLLAYCGAGYQGMQKNPGAVTIEGELEQALAKAGAMPENFDGNPRKVDWMRAARTDKGVSAVGQVVSGMFYVDPPGFVERVNEHLPQQIRLLGFKRVIPTFSAKKFCDRRRYEYVIPTFALDPSAHRDREAVLASEGKEGAFIKCLECSERGRKIPAGKGSHKLLPNKVEAGMSDGQKPSADETINENGTPYIVEQPHEESISLEADSSATMGTPMGNVCDGQKLSANETINENGMPSIAEQPHEESISLEAKSSATLELADSASLLQETERVEQGCLDDMSEPKKETFHFGEAERAKLNRLLNYYVGTHNFHNFTSRVKAEDPSAKRYMVSFEAGDVFTVGNTEFVRCNVVGQSFMLHQIRKMIGLVIAVFRGCAPESILETALRRDANITIPTAPELGLFLDECMYPAYNQKWYNTHEEVSQKGYEPEISRFKHEVIYEHIAGTEYKEGQMALFLHSLNDRNYADFAAAREAEKQLK